MPLLSPALAAASAIVFLFSFTSFGIVLILGGPRYATIEAEIYNRAVRMFDLRAAAILSLVQLACVFAAVVVATRLERRTAAPGTIRPERDVVRPPRTVTEKLVVGASLGGLLVFLGLPLAVLVERSLAVGAEILHEACRCQRVDGQAGHAVSNPSGLCWFRLIAWTR